ncbi:MAG TPA: GNAT family N-acetyltransferase [bacterium]|nr:GNAT family N-acetyltransferase [bacterium]HPN44153.1 GNAT family N-acetyltransferase [bacterium]
MIAKSPLKFQDFKASLHICRAELHHINPVMALIRAVTDDMAAHNLDQWNDNYPTQQILEQDIRQGNLYLLFDESYLCGQVVLNDRQDDEYKTIPWGYHADKVMVVHRLCVHPAQRGRGYAHKLMDFAEHYASANGYSCIRLDAYTANSAAINLYETRNYTKAGEVRFPGRKFVFNCYEKML